MGLEVIKPFRSSAAKQRHYREPVWETVEQYLDGSPAGRAVALLDTGKAEETSHLLRLGYQAPYLHVVNYSARRLAWVKRRYPRVTIHPGPLGLVIPALRHAFDVISYDGMGVVGTTVLPATVVGIVPWIRDGGVLTVTLTAQRETEGGRSLLRRRGGRLLSGWGGLFPELKPQDHNRLDYLVTLVNFAGRNVERMEAAIYRPRHINMLWVVMRLGVGTQYLPYRKG